MAIHELDEIDPIARRVRRLETKVGAIAVSEDGAVGAFPLAGDCEETCVRIDIPSQSGGVVFAQLVVQHRGDDVVAVRFPDGYEGLARVVGMPFEAQAAWEGYLEIMGRMAFAKLDR